MPKEHFGNYLWLVPFSCLLLRLLVQSTPTVTVSTFNSTCDNKHNVCNQSGFLMCISGFCECESPSNQRFDPDLGVCLSIVGGQCSLTQHPPPVRRCITNAHCVLVTSSRYNYTECQCQPGFIENSEGNCVPGIGKPCNYGPDECNPSAMVVCKNGRCNCLDELQVYDLDMRRCVSPAGTHCKYDGVQLGCVKNSICYPFYFWVPPRCICSPRYVQTKNRTCISELEAQALKFATGKNDEISE